MLTLKWPRHMIVSVTCRTGQDDSIKCKSESDALGGRYADDRYPPTTNKIKSNNVSESIHQRNAQAYRGELERLIDI